MGLGSRTLEFVRSVFKRHEYQNPPSVPVLTTFSNAGSSYFAQGMTVGTLQGVTDYLRLDADLVARYIDLEDQDDSPLVASALDIYADDSVQTDITTGRAIWVESKDEEVRKLLDELLSKTLKVEKDIWMISRTVCKYGNAFGEIVAKEGAGVIALNYLPPPTVRRIEIPKEIGKHVSQRQDIDVDTLGFIYDPRGLFQITTADFIKTLEARANGDFTTVLASNKSSPLSSDCAVFESWEMMHIRLKGKNPYSVYGHGVGESARWIFKRLVLLEDSIILHRLTRAPSRYAFYVDVTGIPPNETSAYLNKVKQGLKKQKFVNPNTGKMDMKFDVLAGADDFFLPSREGKDTTRVESLQGPVYDHIEDVKFFENKLFAALKVPKPFLTYEETTAKTHLSAEDSRFARTILRIQSQVRSGYKHVCDVHLAFKGINPASVEYDIKMTVPSAIFELAQLEIKNAELELANNLKGWAPDYWIKQNVLGWSDEMIMEMKRLELSDSETVEPQSRPTGVIDRAISKRASGRMGSSGDAGDSGVPVPEAPAPEVASRRYDRDVIMSSVQRNTRQLLERFESLKQRGKTEDKRLFRMESLLREIKMGQDSLGKR